MVATMHLSRLSSAQTHAALDGTVAITCVLSLLIVLLMLRRRAAALPLPARRGGAWVPWAGFVLVCALLLGNQLIVHAYILRIHKGDAAFITSYLGRGWFAVAASAPPVRWLAEQVPASWLRGPLSYSVLRVQAVLELPFALLAYLAVVAMLDAALYRRLLRSALLPLAAISFTFTFCLIELRLWNPFTVSDLVARWLAAAAVLLLWGVGRLRAAKQESAATDSAFAAPSLGLLGLLVFFLGAAAVGAVILCMYDVALLYNFAHLPARLPILAAGLGLGTLAALLRTVAQSGRAQQPGPGIQGLSALIAAFCAVFFAPSLVIRYCGDRPSAIAGAGLLLLAALALGVHLLSTALAARNIPRWRGLLGLLVAMAVAWVLLAVDAVGWLFGATQPLLELVLLEQAALLLPAAALTVALVELLLGNSPAAPSRQQSAAPER